MRRLMFNFVTARIRSIAFILMLVPLDPPSTREHISSWAQPSNEQQLREKNEQEQCVSTGDCEGRCAHTRARTRMVRQLPNVIFSTCTLEIQSWLLSLQQQINHCWQEGKRGGNGNKNMMFRRSKQKTCGILPYMYCFIIYSSLPSVYNVDINMSGLQKANLHI